MSTERSLTEVFSAERPRLVGLAYRITGSRLDAEDIVQDAWLRGERADWASVDRPEAWLTTVVTRLALDRLKSAQRQREIYVGPWLPEPVVTRNPVGSADGPPDPADVVELADSLTYGFLRMLENLRPLERVVFILAEVFDTPYRDIGAMVDRTPEACRQIASRARRHVRSESVAHDPPDEAAEVLDSLVTAIALGDMAEVVDLLADDVVLLSDGGAGTRAARQPVRGAERAARLLVNLTARGVEGVVRTNLVTVNNSPGAVVYVDDQPYIIGSLRVKDGLVHEVHLVVNPAKLAALTVTTPLV